MSICDFPGIKTDKNLGDEAFLICPVCDYEYTHVETVWTLKGFDESEIQNGEIYGVPCGGETPERRDALVVRVWGECGHICHIVFQQHKGTTWVSTRYVGFRDHWE